CDRRGAHVLGGERASTRVPGAQEDPPRTGRSQRSAHGVSAMSRREPTCREVEPGLVAMGAGEASPETIQVVERHVAACPECRDELSRYRVVDGLVADLRRAPMSTADPSLARAELESRLAELRRRLLRFGVFASPVGPILIARSIEGVSMVEYLE